MSAQENAELVRRAYAAVNTADIATLTELIDENASWHTPGRSPIAGDYRARDAVFGQFGRYGGETDGSFKADLKEVFTSSDGRVIGLHHNSAERNGRWLDGVGPPDIGGPTVVPNGPGPPQVSRDVAARRP